MGYIIRLPYRWKLYRNRFWNRFSRQCIRRNRQHNLYLRCDSPIGYINRYRRWQSTEHFTKCNHYRSIFRGHDSDTCSIHRRSRNSNDDSSLRDNFLYLSMGCRCWRCACWGDLCSYRFRIRFGRNTLHRYDKLNLFHWQIFAIRKFVVFRSVHGNWRFFYHNTYRHL